MDRPNPEGAAFAPPDRESASGGSAGKRMRIVTRCGTVEEFFATFGPFADESSIFIVTNKPRPLGLRQPFVVQLREGETIMRGDVEVIESITDGRGPDGRNGMRLKLLETDEATRDMHRRLLAHARAKKASSGGESDAPPDSVAVASEARPALPTPASEHAVSPTARPPAPANGAAAPAEKSVVAMRPRAPETAQEPGERAPGSSYQLPANPFEGVTAEALESFIECTLYEERVPRGESEFDAPPPSRTGASIAYSAPAAPAPVAAPVAPPPPPVAAPVAPPTFGLAPAPLPVSVPLPAPLREVAFGAPPLLPEPAPAKRKPWILGIAIAVVSSVASLAGAYFFWGHGAGPSSGAAGTASASGAPSAPSSAEPSSAQTASGTAATASASATSTAAPAIPALKRECKAHIRSYPQGAAIQWNGDALGTTPLADAPVPCGPAKVTFDLAGYEHGERSAGAVVGKTAGVFLRLVPILVPIEVTSTPSGAQVLVDGHTVGRTPTSISMVGMRESTLVLTLPRYKSWTQKLTPQPPKGVIHADMEKK